MIPILLNHDHSKAPIGKVQPKEGRLLVTFEDPGISRESFFSTFGNCGMRVIGWRNELITIAEILEFSVSPIAGHIP